MKDLSLLYDLSKKHLLNCLHKVRISVNNKMIYVPCGHCANCLLAKNAFYVRNIKLHSKKYQYSYFCTLTYAPKYVPILRFYPHHEDTIIDKNNTLLTKCEFFPKKRNLHHIKYYRKNKRGDFRRDIPNDNEYISTYVDISLLEKFRAKQRSRLNEIYYAPYRDFQTFFKRLRYEIETSANTVQKYRKKKPHSERFTGYDLTDLSVSYYVVSEYGTEKGRPHWHFLLFTNSEFVSNYLGKFVRKSWSYGRCDTQLSREKCASYVASYLQCVSDMRRLYKSVPPLKPQRYTSIGFAKILIPSSSKISLCEEVYALFTNGKNMPIGDKNILCFPRWSDYNRLFPRPRTDVFSDCTAYRTLMRALWYFCKEKSYGGIELNNCLTSPEVLRLFCLKKFHSYFDSILNILAKNGRYFTLPSYDHILQNPFECIIIEYLQIWPMIQSVAVNMFDISRRGDDIDDIYETTSYLLAFNRMYDFLHRYATACKYWNIHYYDDFMVFVFKVRELIRKTNEEKLYEQLKLMEQIDEDSYTFHYYNYLINETYEQDRKTKVEASEISGVSEKGIFFDTMDNQAKEQIEKLIHYKEFKHKLSEQHSLFNY